MTGSRGRGRKRKMVKVKVPSEVSGVEFEYLVEEVSQLEDLGVKMQPENSEEHRVSLNGAESYTHGPNETFAVDKKPPNSPDTQVSTIPVNTRQTSTAKPTLLETESPINLSWLIDFKVSSLFESVREDSKEDERRPSTPPARDVEPPSQSSEDSTSQSKAFKKPPFTYTELIEQALKEKHQLTVSGIYQWISQRFPYYNQNDDRWKNSVRHNLSINPHFRKGVKASQGAGHLWNLSDMEPAVDVVDKNNWKKNRLKNYLESLQPNEYSSDISPPPPTLSNELKVSTAGYDQKVSTVGYDQGEMRVLSTAGVEFQTPQGGDAILYTPLDDKYPYDSRMIMSTYSNGAEKVEIFSDSISRKSILEYAAHDIIMEEQQNILYSMYEEQEHFDALPLFPDEFTLSCYNNIPSLI